MIQPHYDFFQSNLTNGTLKQRQGDPPYLHRVEHGTQILYKNQYDNTKSSPEFGRTTTYTKEIVTLT